MRTLFREKLFIILALGCLLLHGAASAATLREIIEKNGRDYVLNNVATLASQIDDRDKYFLARILIGNLRGSEAPEILIPLAQKGDLDSIRLLALNFGTGKEGIKTNRSQATLWVARLEMIASGTDEKQRKTALATLCEVFRDSNHALFAKEKAVKYCEEYYKLPDGSPGTQAYTYLNPESPLFDPGRGIMIYERCITDGNPYCKLNFAWQGKHSLDIAKRTTKRQLFEYALIASDLNSSSATNNLGVFYLEGFGTQRDPIKALELFEKAARQNKDHALYNLLQMSFFHYAEWKDAPKTAEDGMVMISYYDYLSPEADRFDSVPFKEWIFSKRRMPSNESEFQDFLRERANAGSDTAACMLAGHFRKSGNLGESLRYAELGRRTKNVRVKHWCEREIVRVDVLNTIKP